MIEYAELEIGIHQHEAGYYTVDIRLSLPNSEAEVRFDQCQAAKIVFDLEELNRLAINPEAYGQKLTQFLFAEPEIKTAFAQARASVQSLSTPLRLRLMIGPSAPELNSLHWETLRDPLDGSPLATSENLLFSRYMSSADWRPVRLRAKTELRALVMVANPSDLGDYNLSPIDVDNELKRAEHALEHIAMTVLPQPKDDQRSTLNNLFARLRESEYDIFYLVCHGALVKTEPFLWLENDQGKVARASGIELVTRLNELAERPRLVVLASCESAGANSGEALAALGPRLAEAGIPAVLAMQGKVSIQTVSEFMPIFFQELQRDGQ
jgi:hypothetical protein